MTDTAIRVENLGKRYQLGAAKSGSFRESMSSLFRRRIRSESHSATSIQPPASSPPESQPDASIQYPANQQDFWALQDINFEIKRGEAVGIIGRNGAGKSTLLKILSRITEPTKGRFEIFGRVSSLLEVGTGFHPELTGRENVYLNGTILGMKRREVKAKFDEIVAFSGVEKFIDTPVKHYSSGMQVRLAFAVAAHLEPEILIIDEVLAVGDAEFQKKCLGKMEDVTGEGRTVLFVSHDLGAVSSLCSRVILLADGSVIKDGNVSEVIDLYSARKKNSNSKQKLVGDVWLTDVTFRNLHTNSEIHDVICGSSLLIELVYDSNLPEGSRIEDMHVGFQVFDERDRFITVFNNKTQGSLLKNLPPRGSLFCKIEKFPLTFGHFYANTGLIINGKLSQIIERAVQFSVEYGNYYDSDFVRYEKRSGVYIDHQWFSKPANEEYIKVDHYKAI